MPTDLEIAKAIVDHELKPRNPALESCAKCGDWHEKRKSFIDLGEGTEAGRVFYYCSEECRRSH